MKNRLNSGYLLVALSALLLSFKSILVKGAYNYQVDAVTLVLMRLYITLPLFIAALCYFEGRRAILIRKGELYIFSVIGVFGMGGAMLFSFLSLELMAASISNLINFTYPAMTILLVALFIRQRPCVLQLSVLLLTFLGMMLITRVDRWEQNELSLYGVLFALISAFCYAIYNLMSERSMRKLSPLRLGTGSIVFMTIVLGLSAGKRSYPYEVEPWIYAALLALLCGFVPFLLYLYGIQKIGAARSVLISSLGPVFTVIWAMLFLGERLDGVQLTGMVVIVCSVAMLKSKEGLEALGRLMERGLFVKKERRAG